MERYKPAIEQKNYEKRANNARRTAGELLGNFPTKIRLVFRFKTFPTNDSLMQKRRNVQDNNDVTKSHSLFLVRSYFGNIFRKPSAGFVLLTFLLLFSAQKEKFPRNFPYMPFLLTLRRYKMAQEKLSKFWFI